MPRVLNRRTDTIPPDAVYVGRPTKWSNPLRMIDIKKLYPECSMLEYHQIAVESYRIYIGHRPDLMSLAKRELRGKDLVCNCSPLPCHADVLLEIVNEEVKDGKA